MTLTWIMALRLADQTSSSRLWRRSWASHAKRRSPFLHWVATPTLCPVCATTSRSTLSLWFRPCTPSRSPRASSPPPDPSLATPCHTIGQGTLESLHPPLAILRSARCYPHRQPQTPRVEEEMTRVTFDLLVAIDAPIMSLGCALDTLPIGTTDRWLRHMPLNKVPPSTSCP